MYGWHKWHALTCKVLFNVVRDLSFCGFVWNQVTLIILMGLPANRLHKSVDSALPKMEP